MARNEERYFFEVIRLPYQAHPQGGLLVVEPLELTAEVTFICPLVYRFHEHLKCWLNDSPKYWEGEEFMPAVEIPAEGYEYSRNYYHWHPPFPELQPHEFWENDLLVFPDSPHDDFFLDEYDDD
ncbi:MAG: hypothetical protein V7K90_04720 [Nostoc sp.]|uniref:hypothetical protein n=1 Tax=Nostoc sp. TaxID=1180 RepID=UPI002FFC7EAD